MATLTVKRELPQLITFSNPISVPRTGGGEGGESGYNKLPSLPDVISKSMVIAAQMTQSNDT